jgi:hypothetical protein
MTVDKITIDKFRILSMVPLSTVNYKIISF